MLVPLDSMAEGSNTPVSKAVIVRLEPSQNKAWRRTWPPAEGRPGDYGLLPVEVIRRSRLLGGA